METILQKSLLLLTTIFFFNGCFVSDTEEKTTSNNSVKKETYGIPWEKDLPTAFAKAKAQNKNLLVMAVSVGCRWCDKMKAQTLSNPEVAKKLKNYVMVQADRETPNERNQLPEFNHVPIIFFMTPNKEVIDNLRGYFEPKDFLDYLNDMEEF